MIVFVIFLFFLFYFFSLFHATRVSRRQDKIRYFIKGSVGRGVCMYCVVLCSVGGYVEM
ncbi:hypothetical protein GGR50DRAFT_657753 [Xylaria sp. CBS 124048]|nr:hypothetical protein GGR50DRAFT_657753 [Xylaria sp. CBS 124048]